MMALVYSHVLLAQSSPFFTNLPVGKYPVGFKIISFTDKSRVTKPLYTYLGERDTSDRYKKVTIHLWYPAVPNTGKGTLTYGDYCYNAALFSTMENLTADKKTGQLNSSRAGLQNFFGDVTDADWNKLTATKLLASKDATPVKQKFPLLVGMLRPLSTAVSNEMMASNGYVVAMLTHSVGNMPYCYPAEIEDMQQAIAYLNDAGMIDDEKIGSYGFSGSGFTQVIFTMYDYRIRALADIESGLFMDGLMQILDSSNLYNANNLQVPFLHLFSRDLSKEEIHIAEFEQRMKYSERYRVLFNTAQLHHWDFATEGRASTTVLHMRGEREEGIKAAFEISNLYLLRFFDGVLKNNTSSQSWLKSKPTIANYNDTLWSIKNYAALKPPPDRDQFIAIIYSKGIDEAMRIAKQVALADPAAELVQANILNAMAQQLRRENKHKESLPLMYLAVELHPGEAWVWRNLSGMVESDGNKTEALRCAEKAVTILKDFQGTETSFNGRIRKSAQEIVQRLKGEGIK